MGTLIPTHASDHIIGGVTEYLTTSFSLTDPAASKALSDFLSSATTGMFRGPYVRTRLPYVKVKNGRNSLDWLPEVFEPYHHQQEAFRRLRSVDDEGQRRQPDPTLVVTGTGSGKSEAFQYPIIDHVLRNAGSGPGVKALILYPMNALANDQTARLAKELSTDARLQGTVTAGIYTGESKDQAKTFAGTPIVTSRESIRLNPPDILLTNYKMLDQLLLRPEDANIWKMSAQSLQYLVLDEFHTYDGAQGTDVALLLRRLGLALKAHQPEGYLTEEQQQAALGRVTPVATSATLGDGDEGSTMVDFASTVFGTTIPEDAVVRERLQGVRRWRASMVNSDGIPEDSAYDGGVPNAEHLSQILEDIEELQTELPYAEAVHQVVCQQVLGIAPDYPTAIRSYPAHLLFEKILEAASTAIALSSRSGPVAADPKSGRKNLVSEVLTQETIREVGLDAAERFIAAALTFMANLRSYAAAENGWQGKRLPGVENHLWLREVSRVDRLVGQEVQFHWGDDGESVEDRTNDWLPACYCRNCGRAGWMIQLEPGTDTPVVDNGKIRTGGFNAPGRQRPLLDASSEERRSRDSGTGYRSDDDNATLYWFNYHDLSLSVKEPDEADREGGRAIPVLTYAGENADDHAIEETCPSCGERNSIRFLGSSIATLLSVGLSNLFGMNDLDSSEKKTLIFTDSVQDAAHRASFVQSRSRSFALRTQTLRAVGSTTLRLSELPTMLIQAADSSDTPQRARFELLPQDIAETSVFKKFWSTVKEKERREATTNAMQRLAFDLALEFGDRADLARSLTSTGSVGVGVEADEDALLSAVTEALESLDGVQAAMFDATAFPEVQDRHLAWARGVIEMIRRDGGINHPWLNGYLNADCNPYLLNRREARARGVPSFARGTTPEFPRTGAPLSAKAAKNHAAVAAPSPKSRYAKWTAQILGMSTHDSSAAVVAVLKSLSNAGILTAVSTDTGGTVYAIDPARVLIEPAIEAVKLKCDGCHTHLGLSVAAREQLVGAPCLTESCAGTYVAEPIPDNYYRDLYSATEPRTVVAEEHTSLLPTKRRLGIENAFRAPDTTAPDAPNVLVATPTLEMGIDIGDLSTVMLASMPTSVASYVQRVGRAGRLTGNSLVLAMVRGRGASLPKLMDPLSVISGAVEPPAAFLSATEILRRQLTAFLIDGMDDLNLGEQPTAIAVFSPNDPGSVINQLVEYVATAPAAQAIEDFCAVVANDLEEDSVSELRNWASGKGEESLVARLRKAQREWDAEAKEMFARMDRLERQHTELEDHREARQHDDDFAAELRSVGAALRQVKAQLHDVHNGEYWISSMERHGLLPNFTLLDDSVTLDLSISYLDPTTMMFDSERREYSRGVATALHELAPGATFYAQGIAATIDSVDIGRDGEDIQQWRVCPSCSHVEVIPADRDAAVSGPCPTCGDAMFADSGQVMPVLPMKKVSAQVDRARNSISDAKDERTSARFHTVVTFRVPEGGRGTQWYLEDGFGIEYLRDVEIRWLNLGKGTGETRSVGGREVAAPLFQVCRHCGHVDTQAGANSKWDHAPWCTHRMELQEDTVTFALGRALSTQGVLMHLPPLIAAGDQKSIPSLIAAIKLGFKEEIGGDPDHLNVTSLIVGSDTGPLEALLLHDQVPGGTGYLTQFSRPDQVHNLLVKAWLRVHSNLRDNPAGPSCLTPYADGRSIDKVDPVVAESALRRILLGDTTSDSRNDSTVDPDAVISYSWQPQEKMPVTDDKTVLELRFRRLFRAALERQGIKVTEKTEGDQVELSFTMPDQKAPWRLSEQKNLGSTIPDFYLSNDRTDLRDIAVYLDGYAFHATSRHMRVGGDVQKRAILYAKDILPWTLTSADLDTYEKSLTTSSVDLPVWFNPNLPAKIAQDKNVSSSALDSLRKDPLSQLLDYLQNPDDRLWHSISEVSALHTMSKNASILAGTTTAERELARGLTIRVDIASQKAELVLSGELWGSGFDEDTRRRGWNVFWNMANLMWLRDTRSTASVSVQFNDTDLPDEIHHDTPIPTKADQSEPTPEVVEPASSPENVGSIDQGWTDIIDEFDPSDEDDAVIHAALTLLAAAGIPAPDDSDTEIEGAPVLAFWNVGSIAILEDDDDEAVDALATTGITALAVTDIDSDRAEALVAQVTKPEGASLA